MSAPAIYVYCIVRRARRPSAARAPEGVPGASSPAVWGIDRQTWLIGATVPLAIYGPGPLEKSLRDLDWVGRVALAHEAVVEHFVRARGTAVIPAKLFTMFSTLERARAELTGRRTDLDRVFRRIAGCEEWGVRVVRGAAPPPGRPRARGRAATGAAFLAEKKRARDASQAARAGAADAAEAAFSSLARLARDRRRRTEAPAGATAPLLDAAFLVPARRRERFQAAADRLSRDVARRGGEMILTGPWPPYNFTGIEDAT